MSSIENIQAGGGGGGGGIKRAVKQILNKT